MVRTVHHHRGIVLTLVAAAGLAVLVTASVDHVSAQDAGRPASCACTRVAFTATSADRPAAATRLSTIQR